MEASGDGNSLSSCSSSHSARSWQKVNFKPKLFQFESNNCRIISNLIKDSLLDRFKLFFDQDLVQTIASKINKFRVNTTDKYASLSSHQAHWYLTDCQEMYLFLATFMLMTRIRKYRIKDYWATDHLIATPIVSDIMPRDRFLLLLTFLHFNDNANHADGDKLYKRRPIMQHLKDKLRRIMFPYRNLCIDESLML